MFQIKAKNKKIELLSGMTDLTIQFDITLNFCGE